MDQAIAGVVVGVTAGSIAVVGRGVSFCVLPLSSIRPVLAPIPPSRGQTYDPSSKRMTTTTKLLHDSPLRYLELYQTPIHPAISTS
ncbi:hypothetical protein TWF696_001708 [Orbilia brochopaga]|uniref:Uncharacterized protein n=1 Tax=Orbilia brochopaga TaxID=3140254 RepID=A0AAV9U946_9PEZI